MCALAGVRVQKVQKVQKVQRVLVAPCGRNIKKTFTTGLSPGKNRQTALASEGKAPFGGWRHHLSPSEAGGHYGC